MNFLFGCCRGGFGGQCYEVRSFNENNKVEIRYVPSLNQLSQVEYKEVKQIMRVKKSQYHALIDKYKGKKQQWTDPSFPPSSSSLGNIPNISEKCRWQRISDFIKNPRLFIQQINPTKILRRSMVDGYFLGAIASMAEKKQTIECAFGDQTQYNPNGIYKVRMRVNGKIEEVLVDDFIPLDSNNKPFFSQPYLNEFWILIIEKAWAKVNGSYSSILQGIQTDVYRSLGCCPAQTFHIRQNKQSIDKIWKFLLQYSRKHYPISCVTKNQNKNWKQSGLAPNQCYNIVCVEILQDNNNQTYKMLKLRSLWSNGEWMGKGNANDIRFWTSILKDEKKNRLSGYSGEGIFSIPYEDFVQYFTEVNICQIEDKPMYEVQTMRLNGKNGNIYTLDVKKQGTYVMGLHQSKSKRAIFSGDNPSPCRSTMILAKGQDYEFIDGVLKYNQYDTQLRAYLDSGRYLLYCKFDPTLYDECLPLQASISTYSTNFVDIKPIEKFQAPDFFKKVFLQYARQNKKKQYENGSMWVSYKLLFEKGGYAYVAFGNEITSTKSFIVQFDQKDFTSMNYKLKKPWKGCGAKKLTIKPGQQQIIVCRVNNNPQKQMRFPPLLNILITDH